MSSTTSTNKTKKDDNNNKMNNDDDDIKMKLPPVVRRIERQQNSKSNYKVAICILMVGMAGSGKTTLMARLQQSTFDDIATNEQQEKEQQQQEQEKEETNNNNNDEKEKQQQQQQTDEDDEEKPMTKMPAYCINLDPATLDVPYNVSIDIRDTVNYKQVMAQHKLGPNGAIMTSLNLYATKFDQVIGILEKRADQTITNEEEEDNNDNSQQQQQQQQQSQSQTQQPVIPLSEYILVDTPGQIEAFTWSASGTIISESFASSFPTVIVFVVDTVRCASSPTTFMSNMLYACSMYYRTRLPLVICFNKIDVVSHDFVMEWMKDFESFQDALDATRSSSDGQGGGGGFYDSLTRSLSLVLDEFYNVFSRTACGVSAVTGDGINDFFNAIQIASTENFNDYIDDLKFRIHEQQAKQRAIARVSVKRFQRDVGEEEEEEEK